MLITCSIIFGLLFIQAEAAHDAEPKIVQGNRAKLGEFPYQVSVQINKNGNYELHCGAVIIDKYNILTAAHCVKVRKYHFGPQDLSVVAGSADFTSRDSGWRYAIRDIKIHENYGIDNGFPNDIAILRLWKPIQFNKYVAPAKLSENDYNLKPGQSAIVSGFGRFHLESSLSSILYKTQVFIEDNDECQRHYYYDFIRPTNICTRHHHRETGFCTGDSGGPLTVNGKVVGIVSFSLGEGCANFEKRPQIYTRVSEYRNWIYHWSNTYVS